jgi:hypothetical protein
MDDHSRGAETVGGQAEDLLALAGKHRVDLALVAGRPGCHAPVLQHVRPLTARAVHGAVDVGGGPARLPDRCAQLPARRARGRLVEVGAQFDEELVRLHAAGQGQRDTAEHAGHGRRRGVVVCAYPRDAVTHAGQTIGRYSLPRQLAGSRPPRRRQNSRAERGWRTRTRELAWHSS